MRRLLAITFTCLTLGCILLGCGQPAAKNDDKKLVEVDPNIQVLPPVKPKTDPGKPPPIDVPIKLVANPSDDKQEKYEAALADALTALADRKFDSALAAFEAARSIQDTEFVQSEIAKLKDRIGQDDTARSTVKNIETVLNEGKADDAIKLTNDAIKEFGAGDDAPKLIQLRLQADALADVQKKEPNDVRYKRYRGEGEAAVGEKNLRAAALAFEQALLARPDGDLQKVYEEIRGKLDRYDAQRKKAAELRRDPAQLEDALAALKDAADAWDTLQLRVETDELLLALAKRRGSVSVADFEVHRDLAMPDAGAAFADEVLPRLKTKFDLVERAQLNKVIAELKLEEGFADDPAQQKQLAQLAKVRYLVVGNIRQIGGFIVNARLVDVQTGLVVQTAKIVAPTMEDALNHAPELAKQLLMNDEEKLAFDAEVLERVSKKVEVVAADAEIPAAPLPPAMDEPAPPKAAFDPAPPPIGAVDPKLFEKFAPPPATPVAPPADMPAAELQQRMLIAAVEMGDNLFRAGRFNEAQRQYEFALNLAPNNFEIRLRLERVRPLLPPPVVFAPQPIYVAKPRLAIMPFVIVGNPNLLPPSLCNWTPNQLAPYFASQYDVVDPAQVFWFMGRMGLSLRDVMVDPVARRWLSRAVGVRYFVFGNHIETASFDVNTYLIDAEYGYLAGSGRIHVQNRFDLRWRLQELASVTLMNPTDRGAYFAVAPQRQFDQLVFLGRQHMSERKYPLAVGDFEEALRLRPYAGQVQFYLADAREKARWQEFEFERQRRNAPLLTILVGQRQRQADLVFASEAARRRAIAEAAARDDAGRQTYVALRFQAQQNMVAQAQFALKTKNFGISVSLFQGAIGVVPVNVVSPLPAPAPLTLYQDLAQARLAAERAERLREAEWIAAREAKLRQERERQLLTAQKQLAVERKQTENALNAQREAQLARDATSYKDSVAQGQRYMTQSKYEAALAAFQGAQRFAHTAMEREQANLFLETIVQRQAESLAKTKEEKADVERKLLVERERRKAAENTAKQNEENYKAALSLAQAALQQKNYDAAHKKFEEAGKLYKTDIVVAGLRQVELGRAALLAAQKNSDAESQKAGRIKQLINEGNAALDAKKFNEAVSAFQQAKKLSPDSLDVMTGLTRAEQLRGQLQTEVNRKAEESARTQNFQRLFKSGQANLANKQYEAAVASLGEAVKLNPTDASALAALKQAEKARDASTTDAKSQAAAKLRAETYQKLIHDGQLALSSKRYVDAIKAFNDAQKVLPGDKASKDLLQDALTAKKSSEDAVAAAAKQRADDLKKASDIKAALTQGRLALTANDLAKASKLLNQAKALDPNDADVLRALRDLDQANQRLTAAAEAQKKRQQQFQTLLDSGKAALTAKRYPEALKALSSATTLIPDSKEAQDLFRRAQTEARQADEATAKANAADKQRQVDYKLALGAGQKALQTNNYAVAVQSFQQALKLNPNDATATKLLQQAQTAQGNLGKATENFSAAMSAGDKALTLKNYGAAVKSYQDALKWVPNDKNATQQLQQAQRLWDASKVKTPPPVDPNKTAFDSAMSKGASLEKERKYGEAMKAYQDALKVRPKDPDALAGMKNNQFYNHLAVGQQKLDTSMWMAAQSEFEAALRMFPNNENAKKLLEKAKKKMK